MTFSTRIAVRGYELDALGHLNHAVYHQYAEVARTEAFEAAGCRWETLISANTAPVVLETHVVFRRELRARDVVDVSCTAKFGTGKTFTLAQQITKVDGPLAADITSTVGLMDLRARRLLPDPQTILTTAGLNLALLSDEA